ncbi:hypothetical protein PG996_014758 [Apiospora saccharicola]|uniref:Uncharacterized protein n=1 Tax=Apiospora saccharicola TaxID=335842 RepID=A0ABR1TJ79_9PEZI
MTFTASQLSPQANRPLAPLDRPLDCEEDKLDHQPDHDHAGGQSEQDLDDHRPIQYLGNVILLIRGAVDGRGRDVLERLVVELLSTLGEGGTPGNRQQRTCGALSDLGLVLVRRELAGWALWCGVAPLVTDSLCDGGGGARAGMERCSEDEDDDEGDDEDNDDEELIFRRIAKFRPPPWGGRRGDKRDRKNM